VVPKDRGNPDTISYVKAPKDDGLARGMRAVEALPGSPGITRMNKGTACEEVRSAPRRACRRCAVGAISLRGVHSDGHEDHPDRVVDSVDAVNPVVRLLDDGVHAERLHDDILGWAGLR